jgi:hypothetical protein
MELWPHRHSKHVISSSSLGPQPSHHTQAHSHQFMVITVERQRSFSSQCCKGVAEEVGRRGCVCSTIPPTSRSESGALWQQVGVARVAWDTPSYRRRGRKVVRHSSITTIAPPHHHQYTTRAAATPRKGTPGCSHSCHTVSIKMWRQLSTRRWASR